MTMAQVKRKRRKMLKDPRFKSRGTKLKPTAKPPKKG